jgi:hypothetical protein
LIFQKLIISGNYNVFGMSLSQLAARQHAQQAKIKEKEGARRVCQKVFAT